MRMNEYIGPERRTLAHEYFGAERRNCMFPGQGDHPDTCPVFNVCIANRISRDDRVAITNVLRAVDIDSTAYRLLGALGALVKKYRVKE